MSFGAKPKIEGVGKRGDSPTLGFIIFGASRQKSYWFENSSRFRISRKEILAKFQLAVRPAKQVAVRSATGQSDGQNGSLTGFGLFIGQLGGDDCLVRSYLLVSWLMCCMMHVLTNVGQVVKNLFPESISLFIDVQVAWSSMTVNGEDDRD